MKSLFYKYRFFIAFYLLMGLIIPAVNSTMAANHELKLRSQRIQSLSKTVSELKAIQLSKDLSIKQKAQKEAELKAQVDDLNKQLQTKKDATVAVAPPAPSGGLGGTTVGPVSSGLSWGNIPNGYTPGNCTALVASIIHVPDVMGNASNWDDYARANGITVSSVPLIGSVAQTDYGFYGHVAYVEAINGGQVELKEANVYGLGVVDERWVPAGDYVYIYF